MPEFLPDAVEPKDPDESKIYTMNWASALNSGATVSSSSWTVSTGLTKVSDAIVSGSTKTSIKVSGGQHNCDYAATNAIVTSDGENLEKTGIIRVRNA